MGKSDIFSDDPNPILLVGMEVEFNIRENTKGLTAINVRIRGNNERYRKVACVPKFI